MTKQSCQNSSIFMWACGLKRDREKDKIKLTDSWATTLVMCPEESGVDWPISCNFQKPFFMVSSVGFPPKRGSRFFQIGLNGGKSASRPKMMKMEDTRAPTMGPGTCCRSEYEKPSPAKDQSEGLTKMIFAAFSWLQIHWHTQVMIAFSNCYGRIQAPPD